LHRAATIANSPITTALKSLQDHTPLRLSESQEMLFTHKKMRRASFFYDKQFPEKHLANSLRAAPAFD
jgi:hypothetical protein